MIARRLRDLQPFSALDRGIVAASPQADHPGKSPGIASRLAAAMDNRDAGVSSATCCGYDPDKKRTASSCSCAVLFFIS
jgi:hypothetical protein